MKKKLPYILFLVFIHFNSNAQTLRNEGKINVTGGYLLITGNYQNESAAGITLDGTITVSGNWTNNGTTNVISSPGSNGEVIFNGNGVQTIGGTANIFDFEKLTINTGSITQVEAGKGVSAYGDCTFNSPLVLKASVSLNAFHPQMATFINHSTVTGNITMELPYTSTGTAKAASGRSMYFSSPVSNATAAIFNVESKINHLWYQNEVLRQYVKIIKNTDPLTVAKGYILRSASSDTFSFTGAPNTVSSYSNNNVQRLATDHYYLLGNPFPAVLDWDAVAKTNLASTIWYSTCLGTGTIVVDTWNTDSRVGTDNNGISQVNGKIPPMQSFWIQCSAVGQTGTFTLSSSNRMHNQGTTTILKSGQTDDKSIIRLNLFTNEMKDETVIVESSSAQDIFDKWDSRKMFQKDGKRAEVYSLSPDSANKNLVIQSIKPVTSDKSIRLGIYTGVAGTYKFKADLKSSNRSGDVFLEDTQLDSIQNLFVNAEYTFSSAAIEDTSRFILHFFKKPVVKARSYLNICSPNMADLTTATVTEGSDAGLTYTYWMNSAATVPCLNPAAVGTGSYYIKGTTQNGLSSVAGPVHVVVNEKPVIVVNNPPAVQAPATIDLTKTEITSGSTQGLMFSYWTDAKATIPCKTPQFATKGQYYIKGIVPATGCYSISDPVQVTITSISTGINDKTNEIPVVYASGSRVYLKNCPENAFIYIYDMLGRRQYTGNISSNYEIIEPGLKTGEYLLQVLKGKSVISKKIYLDNGNN